MNRDAMLVALGVGVGALISTEQGRHIIGSLAKTPVAQALGEGTVNLFKNMGKESGPDGQPEQSESQNSVSEQSNTAEQQEV